MHYSLYYDGSSEKKRIKKRFSKGALSVIKKKIKSRKK